MKKSIVLLGGAAALLAVAAGTYLTDLGQITSVRSGDLFYVVTNAASGGSKSINAFYLLEGLKGLTNWNNQTNFGHLLFPDPENSGYAVDFYPADRTFAMRDARLGFNAWLYGSGEHGINSNLTVSGKVGIGAAPGEERLRVNGHALIETNAEVRGTLNAHAAFVTNLVQVAKSLTYDGTNVLTDATAGNQFRLTLTQNSMLLSPANSQDGQRITWELIQDETGIRTMIFGSAFKFGSDVPVAVLTTNGGKRDFLTAVCNGTDWYVVGFIRGF